LDDIAEDESEFQYLVNFRAGNRTEVLTYNGSIHHLNQQHSSYYQKLTDGERTWICTSIEQYKRVDHQWFVLVKWEDGYATWESLSIIAKDNSVICFFYAKEKTCGMLLV
jgi:hypothetical protein